MKHAKVIGPILLARLCVTGGTFEPSARSGKMLIAGGCRPGRGATEVDHARLDGGLGAYGVRMSGRGMLPNPREDGDHDDDRREERKSITQKMPGIPQMKSPLVPRPEDAVSTRLSSACSRDSALFRKDFATALTRTDRMNFTVPHHAGKTRHTFAGIR